MENGSCWRCSNGQSTTLVSYGAENELAAVTPAEPSLMCGMGVWHLLPPSQIVSRLTFFTPNLTSHLIQKICANIVKFKSLLKKFY